MRELGVEGGGTEVRQKGRKGGEGKGGSRRRERKGKRRKGERRERKK